MRKNFHRFEHSFKPDDLKNFPQTINLTDDVSKHFTAANK